MLKDLTTLRRIFMTIPHKLIPITHAYTHPLLYFITKPTIKFSFKYKKSVVYFYFHLMNLHVSLKETILYF